MPEESPIDKKAIRTMKGDILRLQKETGKKKLEPAEVFEMRAEKEKTRKKEDERKRRIEESIKQKDEQKMKQEQEELLRIRKAERLKEIEEEKRKNVPIPPTPTPVPAPQPEADQLRAGKQAPIPAPAPVPPPVPKIPEKTKQDLLEKKEVLKKERFEIGRKFRELTKSKEPLEEKRILLSKEIDQVKKDFQPITINEKRIEQEQEVLEEKEAMAKTPEQRRKIEKERWSIEEKRRELEKKRWPWDDKVKKFNTEINELDDQLSQIELEEKGLIASQGKINEKGTLIDLQLEKIDLEEEFNKVKALEDSFDEDKIKLDQEINKNRLNLDGILIKEEKIEQKKKVIEQEEKTIKEIDKKRELEKERWEIDENRRKIEAKRWETEEEKQKLESQAERLENRIQLVLEKRNSILAREQEINEKLGQKQEVTDKPVVKPTPKPVIEPVVKKPEEPKDDQRLEQARKRIEMLKKKLGKEIEKPITPVKPFKPEITKSSAPPTGPPLDKASLSEQTIKKEQRRQELMQRLKAPLGPGRKIGLAGAKPSSDLVRIIPQRPTFREKLWVRILIIIIVFVLLTGVVSFWYWFFKVRSQLPVEENGPEEQVPLGEVVIPETLFPVDSIKVVLISGPEEVPQLLSQALGEQADQGKFKRVIVKTKSRVLNLKEFFQSLLIEMPEDFYLRMTQDFTLFIYPQSQGNRLGLVTKVLDKPGLEGFFALRETTLEHDLDSFFELQGKDKPGIVSYFRNASDVSGYSGPNFRYQTLTTSDLGICYFVSDDYFVLTSSWNSMEKVLKKLTTN